MDAPQAAGHGTAGHGTGSGTGHGTAGLVLAAGAGRRMGGPKALLRTPGGRAWATVAADLLAESGCRPVLVVVGAAADAVRATLPPHAEPVSADDWAEGMGASLRAGLQAATGRPGVTAVLIVPVDVPSLDGRVLDRILAHSDPGALVRATYRGSPGHPVLIGREHWPEVTGRAVGDEGARAYLRDHPALEIECADLADGGDVDSPETLPAGHRVSAPTEREC